jgi:hypothetical protein
MTLNCPCFTNKKLEYTDAMTATILTNPEDIQQYRLRVIASGLKLELAGMRHSQNAVFKAAKSITGKKTRVACLAEIQKLIK